MRRSASIAVLLAALAPGLALADDCAGGFGGHFGPGMRQADQGMGRGGMAPAFATLDGNGDGKVTAEEVAVWRQAQFAAADSNGDGKLEAAELTVWIEARRAEREAAMSALMITRMDQDGDGALSLVELPGADMANRLGWLDRNADGAVDAGEFAAAGPGGPAGPGGRHGKAPGAADTCDGPHGRGGMQ